MREIKFRAWDDEKKEYFNNKYPGELHCVSSDKINYLMIPIGVHEKQDFIMEQFTGLHDKNGREIYEGDVITANITEYTIETMGEIVYDEYYSAFGNKNLAGVTLLFKLDSIEIIGNIHENPELLS